MDAISAFLSKTLSSHGTMDFWSILVTLAVAYAGGVLSSLTPCVYPMIPITISVVGGTSTANAHKPEGRLLKDALFRGVLYVLGMTVVYAFLGVLAGITGKVFGSFTNTQGWYLFLGILMAGAALAMMEVVPFDPLLWWETLKRRLKPHPHGHAPVLQEHRELTLLGVFGLGISSGFIASPCTTPVLTAILAYIAQTQSVILGFALMTSFALGLGTLLVLIGTFTGLVQIMPRSGNWMKTIKLFSGLLLLAFSGYLVFKAGSIGGRL